MTNGNGIGWHHPVDESDQWDGFNEPGIEHFAGSPIRHLAREVTQNALDAGMGEAGIVDVRLRLHEVDVSSIPNVNEFRANVVSCYEASKGESKKAETFFGTAKGQLSRAKISVLEVSDYNTMGMKGPSVNGTPFYAFMKAKGQSRKDSHIVAGSYGIGKFAPYAVSNLRAVFISTVYQDESGEFTQLTQGKSILMSHDLDGKRKQGAGFWGISQKCQPIKGTSPFIPNWIQRAESPSDFPASQGSKLTVLGFEAIKNWQEHLAVSVAENFFGAISDGRLRVEVDDKYVLDQSTIHGFFGRDDIRKLIETLKGEPDQFDSSKSYLAAYTGGVEVITEETEQRELGMCQVKILIGEKLPKKVCVLRNGMFITDTLNRLRSFSDFKEFVAVFHCQSTKGNELLRAMEPPRHDDFEPERASTREEQRKGARALAELATWIRDMLKRHAKDPVSDVTQIDELTDFFGDEDEAEGAKGTEEVNPYGDVIIRGKPIRFKSKLGTIQGLGEDKGDDEGGEGGGGGSGGGGGDGLGGKGTGEGGVGGGTQKPLVDINNVRAILTGPSARTISFTPIKTAKLVVRVLEAGADSDYDVEIVRATHGEVQKGGVLIDATAGTRVNVGVELKQEFSGALKVVAHEV